MRAIGEGSDGGPGMGGGSGVDWAGGGCQVREEGPAGKGVVGRGGLGMAGGVGGQIGLGEAARCAGDEQGSEWWGRAGVRDGGPVGAGRGRLGRGRGNGGDDSNRQK